MPVGVTADIVHQLKGIGLDQMINVLYGSACDFAIPQNTITLSSMYWQCRLVGDKVHALQPIQPMKNLVPVAIEPFFECLI